MKEKISLIQMDVELGQVARNYEKAVQLMELALKDKPDILVLPETLNTGFFPSPDSALHAASDRDGVQTKKVFGAFAKEHGVNIVAGSVSVLENGCVFNRSYIFDRKGEVVASYDKIHGFSRWEKRSRIPAALPRSTLRWMGSPVRWRSAMMYAFVS